MRLVYKSALALYLIALGFGVFTPRPDLVTPGAKPVVSLSAGDFPSIGRQVLYLGGTWAWIGNFLTLIPLVFSIHRSWLRLHLQTIFIISLLVTIAIEFIQLYIPGRVSDVPDVVMNGTGAGLTLLYFHWKEISKTRAPK